MATTIRFDEDVAIPTTIQSLSGFRAWATSDAFPDRGRIDYLQGSMEVDMSPEDLHTHGKVKLAIATVLWTLAETEELGEVYSDRARVSVPAADLSVEPDVVFASEKSLESGRARLVPRAGGEPDCFVEIEGPVDLIVEIVNDKSVAKDTKRLPQQYFQAGVTEYWLVDARREDLKFQIHRRGHSAYEPVPPDPDGYQHSPVLNRRFRLIRRRNSKGRVTYRLEESPAKHRHDE